MFDSRVDRLHSRKDCRNTVEGTSREYLLTQQAERVFELREFGQNRLLREIGSD
jgi:hypothetical protein